MTAELRHIEAFLAVARCGTFTRAAKMIELLTGLTAREVEAISLEDMRGLGEITRPFFTALQPAATSSARWRCTAIGRPRKSRR